MTIEPREAALERTAAQKTLKGLMHKAREQLIFVNEPVIELGEVVFHSSIKCCELKPTTLV